LPPDIYDDTGNIQATLKGQTPDIDLVPISCSVPPGQDCVWKFPATDTSALLVSQGVGRNPTVVNLDLSPQSTIALVAAGSSSAMGEFGSPTLEKNGVNNALGNFNLSFAERTLYSTAILSCLPFGLQNFSSPTEESDLDNPWSPKYRYLDGGFTDDTALVHTISRMQADCSSNPTDYDCGGGIRAILNLDVGDPNEFPYVARLFANCDCGNSAFDYLGTAINPQIFAEDWPEDLSDPAWTMYSNVTYDFGLSISEPVISYIWRGSLTTVENIGWGVTAGTKVSLVMVFVGAQK
jgi:hypothetical protein